MNNVNGRIVDITPAPINTDQSAGVDVVADNDLVYVDVECGLLIGASKLAPFDDRTATVRCHAGQDSPCDMRRSCRTCRSTERV